MLPDEADEMPFDFTYGEVLFSFAYGFVRYVLILVGLLLCIALITAVIAVATMAVLHPLLRRLSSLRREPQLQDDRQPQEPAA
ncbi:hypothetical protein [Streptosporangium lutulentum]|uniref:Cellulose synthase/poly-beta-1,6-N-acetylglucosamine synthase-like glycosyltransferase n=1 Tax=Streptosporangium lutulentum TaxID=1461250 RepID=A0ABT9Q4C9_9ACTN|nr:hypothetical protein [Streptosporangium lutulentum]MDP9841592.1 cellulose synthase/poly-beta-1,6-N-acetylglucosamine synthase-like glycosyltransferase [Streptosporangium lutulentum]